MKHGRLTVVYPMVSTLQSKNNDNHQVMSNQRKQKKHYGVFMAMWIVVVMKSDIDLYQTSSIARYTSTDSWKWDAYMSHYSDSYIECIGVAIQ